MYHDPEINALSNVFEVLKVLNNAQIKRIIDWVTSKFELDKKPVLKAVEREVAPSSEPAPVKAAEPAVVPVKKRRGRKPKKAPPMVEETQPQPAASGIKGFMKYDTFEDLLISSNAKTNTAKILLAASYLQEKKIIKEFGSYDISTLFKKIGEEVSQPSSALNNLMSKKPPLLLQTGTQGTGLKSRRKFRVTEEGLRIARNYISQ
jgi:hypothetical protein